MVRQFNTNQNNPQDIYKTLQSKNIEAQASVTKTVRDILDDVAKNGDDAVIAYTNQFDRVRYTSLDQLTISPLDIKSAYDRCDKAVIEALTVAAERIEAYHTKQMPVDLDYHDDSGVRLGNLWKPIERIGIYVPGGLASYPSSVLMNAMPARVAGVSEIAMVVPAPDNQLNPAVLVAANIVGIEEIYKIGGAQAIGALAFGGKNRRGVDKIVGPGNAFVAAAKRELFGMVGIDMIAGPSEILVVADSTIDPSWVAADLLSQAEHDVMARSILITNEEDFANAVIKQVETHLTSLDRHEIAAESWNNNGAVIVDKDFNHTVWLVDAIAPEHLEIATSNAESLMKEIRNAGAIFLGHYTPEAIGDYTAGPSHVLPTSGTARFSSGLSVYDFLKRVSLISCDQVSFNNIAQHTEQLALDEGLSAHALSIAVRKNHE